MADRVRLVGVRVPLRVPADDVVVGDHPLGVGRGGAVAPADPGVDRVHLDSAHRQAESVDPGEDRPGVLHREALEGQPLRAADEEVACAVGARRADARVKYHQVAPLAAEDDRRGLGRRAAGQRAQVDRLGPHVGPGMDEDDLARLRRLRGGDDVAVAGGQLVGPDAAGVDVPGRRPARPDRLAARHLREGGRGRSGDAVGVRKRNPDLITDTRVEVQHAAREEVAADEAVAAGGLGMHPQHRVPEGPDRVALEAVLDLGLGVLVVVSAQDPAEAEASQRRLVDLEFARDEVVAGERGKGNGRQERQADRGEESSRHRISIRPHRPHGGEMQDRGRQGAVRLKASIHRANWLRRGHAFAPARRPARCRGGRTWPARPAPTFSRPVSCPALEGGSAGRSRGKALLPGEDPGARRELRPRGRGPALPGAAAAGRGPRHRDGHLRRRRRARGGEAPRGVRLPLRGLGNALQAPLGHAPRGQHEGPAQRDAAAEPTGDRRGGGPAGNRRDDPRPG